MSLPEKIAENLDWIKARARRLCGDPHDAEDLAAETIWRCLNHPHPLDLGRSLKPWIATVMVNVFRVSYNRRKCVQFVPYEMEDRYISDTQSDHLAILNDLREIIRYCRIQSKSIESLLLYIDGYTYEEIARLQGIPIGTVKSRLSIGRYLIRTMLE